MTIEEQFKELRDDFKGINKQFQNIKIVLYVAVGIGSLLGLEAFVGIRALSETQDKLDGYKSEVSELKVSLDSVKNNFKQYVSKGLNKELASLKKEMGDHAKSLLSTKELENKFVSKKTLSRWELVKKGSVSKEQGFDAECEYKWIITGSAWKDHQGAVFYSTLVKKDVLISYTQDGDGNFIYEFIDLGKENLCQSSNNREIKAKLFKRCASKI